MPTNTLDNGRHLGAGEVLLLAPHSRISTEAAIVLWAENCNGVDPTAVSQRGEFWKTRALAEPLYSRKAPGTFKDSPFWIMSNILSGTAGSFSAKAGYDFVTGTGSDQGTAGSKCSVESLDLRARHGGTTADRDLFFDT
jgi:hypothetical protein